MSQKKLLGLTGPSKFTPDCVTMIEELFDSNLIYLNQRKEANIKAHLDHCDGLVLAGGTDIHPSLYARLLDDNLGNCILNEQNLTSFDFARDCRELQMIAYCFEKRIPILGICRGHQLLGVYHNIPVIPDLQESDVVHQPYRSNITPKKDEPMHPVTLVSDKYTAPPAKEKDVVKTLLGEHYENMLLVNSFHHQGLLRYKDVEFEGVDILGTSYIGIEDYDNIIELMQSSNGKRFLSAQWHPEYDWKENSYSRDFLLTFKKKFLNWKK